MDIYDYHQPVLLAESIEQLNLQPNGIYVDATFGGGGHSRAILAMLNEQGRLFGFDQDPDAHKNALHDARFTLIPQNFRHLKRFLRLYGVSQVDGILADLGVSWHQLKTPERGFSIHFNDDQLDMRMDKDNEQLLTARKIINTYSADKLTYLFETYGELPGTKRLVQAILTERRLRPIETVLQLKILAQPFIKNLKQTNRYYAQLFQALRIEVNEEMQVLQDLLTQSAEVLKPNGRLVVISYHSLEDRIVKNYFKRGVFDDTDTRDFYGNTTKPFEQTHKKVMLPTEHEIKDNPKARSAKMRVGERV
ncbi:MAG: 16S rRNA (cytosine(1402)-N(4))-methyltransferase RsmH [Sphingobacteriales bacterium]|nr:16S rRNA (cytosine(1402)-N(4))-methyltransferase RsmH [Sphingobacteriales bacterium]